MKAKMLIAAVAVSAAAGSAFAGQTYPYVDFSNAQSTLSRAEVQASAATPATQQEYVTADANFVPAKTRAQVVAELRQAQEDGSYQLAQQEYEGQFPTIAGSHTRLAAN